MSDNSTVKTGMPQNDGDERRNASGYKLNGIALRTRSGALKASLMKTENCCSLCLV